MKKILALVSVLLLTLLLSGCPVNKYLPPDDKTEKLSYDIIGKENLSSSNLNINLPPSAHKNILWRQRN